MAHREPAPGELAPATLVHRVATFPRLSVEDQILMADRMVNLRKEADSSFTLFYRWEGRVGVVHSLDLPGVVGQMRQAIASGFVLPAFRVTDAGRQVLERETCAWCEKPITDDQVCVTLSDGSLAHARECKGEYDEYERWTAAVDADLARVRPVAALSA